MTLVRAWTEFLDRRAFSTPNGPIVAHKDEVVMVVVAKNWEAAAQVIAKLDGKT